MVPPHRPAAAATFHPTSADLTLLYPLLADVDFSADLFVLNPPSDLHWSKDRLARLAESRFDAVAQAFAATDPRLGPGKIDSTIATLMIALDRSTWYGEGFLIANASTMNRLIFAPGAPYAPLAAHIWYRLDFPSSLILPGSTFTIAVLYFAASHQAGPPSTQSIPSMQSIQSISTSAPHLRLTHRQGGAVDYLCDVHTQTLPQWNAATTEYQAAQQPVRTDWNLWLDPAGLIATNLSLYQELILNFAPPTDHRSLITDHSPPKIDMDLVRQLHSLRGKRPMQLVLQRAQRQALEQAAFHSPWRVQPELQQAIKDAIHAYHQERAPLYPLSPTQRLGYLDESDTILCIAPFPRHQSPVTNEQSSVTDNCLLITDHYSPPLSPTDHCSLITEYCFLPGHSYPVITRTVQVTRTATRPNNAGIDETVLYTGSELAILITGENDRTICFMDARLREPGMIISEGLFPEATLQDLCDHFDIPTVPDVATINPTQYQAHIDTLLHLEQLLS